MMEKKIKRSFDLEKFIYECNYYCNRMDAEERFKNTDKTENKEEE